MSECPISRTPIWKAIETSNIDALFAIIMSQTSITNRIFHIVNICCNLISIQKVEISRQLFASFAIREKIITSYIYNSTIQYDINCEIISALDKIIIMSSQTTNTIITFLNILAKYVEKYSAKHKYSLKKIYTFQNLFANILVYKYEPKTERENMNLIQNANKLRTNILTQLYEYCLTSDAPFDFFERYKFPSTYIIQFPFPYYFVTCPDKYSGEFLNIMKESGVIKTHVTNHCELMDLGYTEQFTMITGYEFMIFSKKTSLTKLRELFMAGFTPIRMDKMFNIRRRSLAEKYGTYFLRKIHQPILLDSVKIRLINEFSDI